MSVIKFNRNFSELFNWDSDADPTTEQEYQGAVRNWTEVEMDIVDTLLWQPETAYSVGNIAKTPSLPSQYILVCTEAGDSGVAEPDYTGVSVGDTVVDGTATWLVSTIANGGNIDALTTAVEANTQAIGEHSTAIAENTANVATNTENIATNAENIATNASDIANNATDIDIAEKRISNIEKLLQGNLYDYQTDTDSAYTKTVPSGALPYAGVEQIGGKTLVWNQLLKNRDVSNTGDGITTAYDSTTHLVSITNNSRTTNYGSGSTQILLTDVVPIIGHKYIVRVTPQSNESVDGVAVIFSNNQAIRQTYQPNTIATFSSENSANGMRLRITSAYDFTSTLPVGDVAKYYINVTDLTLLYGAGNEPSTVQEFEAMFPASYYPYNAGTLLSAGVTEVKSVGKNRINVGMPYYSGNGLYNQGVGVHFASGLNPNVNIQKVNDSEYTMSVASTWQGLLLVVPLKSGESVHLSGTISSTVTNTIRGTQYYLDAQYNVIQVIANISSSTDTVTHDVTRTAPSNCAYFATSYLVTNTSSVVTFKNMQCEYGTTATAYTPYKELSYPIPAEIQALEGYGWSAGSVYNYVDFERKVFVKRVGRLDLGSTEATWYYNTAQNFFSCVINGMNSTTTTNAIVQGYTLKSASTGWANMVDYEFGISAGSLRLHNSAYTASEAFKQTLVGKYAYYELAEPIETDISAYITDDNLIEVEAGGTLTFPNSNGDNYRIPVPSEETYMINLQEAVSNG